MREDREDYVSNLQTIHNSGDCMLSHANTSAEHARISVLMYLKRLDNSSAFVIPESIRFASLSLVQTKFRERVAAHHNVVSRRFVSYFSVTPACDFQSPSCPLFVDPPFQHSPSIGLSGLLSFLLNTSV